MSRVRSVLLGSVLLGGQAAGLSAQPPPTQTAHLIEQNQLVAEVARRDPDGLWSLVRELQILSTGRRDGGPARAGSVPSSAEAAQIEANPALRLAYRNDPAATLALLRSTNEALRRAELRDAAQPTRRVALIIGSSGDGTW